MASRMDSYFITLAVAGLERSNAGRVGLGRFFRDPAAAALERLEGMRFVQMDHRVELPHQLRMEVMALALGFRKVDDADRALQARRLQSRDQFRIAAQEQHEALGANIVEER